MNGAEIQRPTLIYLYGPPAAGKLTIANELAEVTGFRVFHNHLTVNAVRPVFDFGTPAFTRLVHRLRLDVFENAIGEGISLIFTNNSAWQGDDARSRFVEFSDNAERLVERAGGSIVFAWIVAPSEVLEDRVEDRSRHAHGKLVDPERLREMLGNLDNTPLHPGDLKIDTSLVSATEAARIIAARLVIR